MRCLGNQRLFHSPFEFASPDKLLSEAKCFFEKLGTLLNLASVVNNTVLKTYYAVQESQDVRKCSKYLPKHKDCKAENAVGAKGILQSL
jgi:hypothetical protein